VTRQSSCRRPHGRRDLLWLIGERGGVQFEGRLDHRDELRGWRPKPSIDLTDGVGDGEVGQVHGDQFHRFADEIPVELAQVGALQIDHSGVGAQPTAELTRAGVDGVDAGRPSVKEGLGEATGRRPQVEGDDAGRANPEGAQGVGELDRPAQWARAVYPDDGVRRTRVRGLVAGTSLTETTPSSMRRAGSSRSGKRR
jgi:hypothetical protein